MKQTTQQREEFKRLLNARLAKAPHRKDPDKVLAELEAEIQNRRWRAYPRPHWCTNNAETCGVCFCPSRDLCRFDSECDLC